MNIQMNESHGVVVCDSYFIGLQCVNTNVVHYLDMEVMCMIFIYKQHEKIQYLCPNKTNKHMTFVFKQYTQHRCSNNINR
jgi:hypothetical protein